MCACVWRLFLEKLEGTCLLYLAAYSQSFSTFLSSPSAQITSVVEGTELTSDLVLKGALQASLALLATLHFFFHITLRLPLLTQDLLVVRPANMFSFRVH